MDIYEILEDAKRVFERYALNDNDGARLVTNENEAMAYALSRMPATLEAVKFALAKTFEVSDAKVASLIDFGAGTGSATWAAEEVLGISDAVCLEREAAMRAVR